MRGHPHRDGGFTLTELLVVSIVIGVLVAIAVPAYRTARRAAIDRATLSDLRNVGLVMQEYYADDTHTKPLIYGQINGNLTIRLAATNWSWQQDTQVTYGTIVTSFTANATATTWCIAMGNGDGSPMTWTYTPAGIAAGSCP